MLIDCKIALNYLNELKRMCNTFQTCADCPFDNGDSCMNDINSTADAEKKINIVQKWSNEHRRKTLLEDFLEKFPDAPLGSDGYPKTCAEYIYGIRPNRLCGDEDDCRKCWDMPVKE